MFDPLFSTLGFMHSLAVLSPGAEVAKRVITEYTLTPEQMDKARALYRTENVLILLSTIYSLVVIFAVVGARLGSRLERLADSLTRRSFVKPWIVVPGVFLTLSVLELPFRLYGHHLGLRYGLSVQGWAGWAWDWTKAQLFSLVIASLLLWGFYWLVRVSPRRWWFWAWLASIPVILAGVFAAPVIFDPAFNRFEPLASTNPQLTTALRDVAQRAGLDIPESRIFEMKASDKVTTYNAYVTGFGATKRIVVWDNTARDMTIPQILFVFGHETGHYVLNHIYKGIAVATVMLFAGLWLTRLIAEWVVARWGERLGIPTVASWASLPLLLLIWTVLSFVSEPIGNAYSRRQEHQADVYGLRLMRNVADDPGQIAAQSFQLLGEKSYDYPSPSRFLVFWGYTHPPISDRVRFAASWREP